jgi:GDP/UDP-N,N'-diacetylbacillosamine 2-epimerase (hydrolysing)
MKRICIITGTRAEYGLLKPLIEKISSDPDFQLQIIATAMHISPEFGLTYKSIIEDGFFINKKIETLLSSDSSIGIAKSMGLTQISFAEAFAELNPDLVIVLGDRSEIFAAVSAATVCCIPIAHIHGGELTQGAYDDAFRHSITKMSHLHFTSTEEYRLRVIQMGEKPNFVFNVGAIGVDSIKNLKLLNKVEFENSINKKLFPKNLLITFHPVTLDNQSAQKQFNELLAVLDELEDTLIIFTKPNSDKDGRIIITMIDEFVSKNSKKSIAFTSLGQLRYLSAMQFVDAVVGNSSSGIIEVPFFKIPTINIGDRQKGRVRCDSIIDCSPDRKSIKNAVKKVYSKPFLLKISKMVLPYGNGNAAKLITSELKKVDFSNLLKKNFMILNISIDFTIDINCSLIDVLKKIDNNPSTQTVFVLNSNILVGTLTDGDIRRGFIKGLNLNSPIEEFMCKDYKYIKENHNCFSYLKELRKSKLKAVPLINNKGELLKIYDFSRIKSLLPIDAVIMAGGKGERLKPLTDKIPKPLLKVGNKEIIAYNIERLLLFGINNQYITVNYLANQITDFCKTFKTKLISQLLQKNLFLVQPEH